ncbi:MAG: response regulator [Janthinobacterium lividum]
MNTHALPASCIPVLLVDDHQMVIEGIKTLLKSDPDLRVVACANSGAEALRRLREHPEVQVAVVDLSMPLMSGVELTRRVRQDFPAVRILALSMFHDHATIQEVLEAGGSGYLLKNTTRQELSTAIRQVAYGRSHFSPEVGQTLLQNLELPGQRTSGPARPPELTTREREILQLIAQEKSNHDIAEQLFISERTVETHRKNMLTKTKSKSVIGLIQYALKHKLLAE